MANQVGCVILAWSTSVSTFTRNSQQSNYINFIELQLLLRYKINLNIRQQFKMMDKINQNLLELKRFVSQAQTDCYKRDQTLSLLLKIKEYHPQISNVQLYIADMENKHEKLSQNMSMFIDSFWCLCTEFSNNLQSIENELQQTKKTQSDQKHQNQMYSEEMNNRILQLNKQIFAKQEECRQLNIKLQQKDAQIDKLEKETNEYLNKMETQFCKHQKALEDSYQIITKLEQEIAYLKNQNQHLIDLNSLLQKSRVQPKVSLSLNEEGSISAADKYIEVYQSHQPHSLHSSLFNSRSQRGVNHFQALIAADIFNSNQSIQMPKKTGTLKQMLKLSIEKEYLAHYNKYQNNHKRLLQKQNYCVNDSSLSKSKQEMWMINDSLDYDSPNKMLKFNTKEDRRAFDPYYNFFVITSQNAKINCGYLQRVQNIVTEDQWTELIEKRIPLHEWEQYLREYLLRSIQIIE